MYIMIMVKIYRIENSDGVGPYQSYWKVKIGYLVFSTNKLLLDHSRDDDHPGPGDYDDDVYYEKICECPEHWVYGFTSMRDLRAWFCGSERNWLIILKAAGYNVVTYEVDEDKVCVLDKQCIFEKS